ncbi:MAG TPA: phosphatase PAP2 family protein [Actinomycetes bacterium]|nr:phosphatase PAP2 family protein [Actinomycetes bacterium]
MSPLLIALVCALLAGAITFGVMSAFERPRSRKPVRDDVPPPSRMLAVVGAVVGVILIGGFLGGLAEVIESNSPVVRWDNHVEKWASDNAGPVATDALRVVTHMGDTVTIICLAVVCCVGLLWAGHRRLALFLATVVVGQWLIANVAKELVERARPDLDPLSSFSGFSFPSGHSTAAAATYLALAIVAIALRPSWKRSVLIAGAVVIAVAVAASRSLLGVHWFSDVVGGLIVGWAWCLICAVLYDVLRRKPLPSGSTSTVTSSPSAT